MKNGRGLGTGLNCLSISHVNNCQLTETPLGSQQWTIILNRNVLTTLQLCQVVQYRQHGK